MSNEDTITALLLNASNAYSEIAPKADSHKSREQLLRLALSFLDYARKLRFGEIIIPQSLFEILKRELDEAVSACGGAPIDFNKAIVEGNQAAILLSDLTNASSAQFSTSMRPSLPGLTPRFPVDGPWPFPPNWPWWPHPPRQPIGPFPLDPHDPEDPIYREIKDRLRQEELQKLIERSRFRYR
jgi:hypothetical protein